MNGKVVYKDSIGANVVLEDSREILITNMYGGKAVQVGDQVIVKTVGCVYYSNYHQKYLDNRRHAIKR